MSLCAIGTPSSGAASPAARRASAARACASARLVDRRERGAEPLVRWPKRSSRCSSGSTLESFPAARARAELGDAELVQFALTRSPSARDRARRSTAGALRWLASRSTISVTSSSRSRRCGLLHRGERRVERLDAARLDRAHLLDDAKEAVELLEHRACSSAPRSSRASSAMRRTSTGVRAIEK